MNSASAGLIQFNPILFTNLIWKCIHHAVRGVVVTKQAVSEMSIYVNAQDTVCGIQTRAYSTGFERFGIDHRLVLTRLVVQLGAIVPTIAQKNMERIAVA